MKNHANIAAAQSTPATLAVDRLRSRKSRSGINGTRTRDSIATKVAKTAAAAPAGQGSYRLSTVFAPSGSPCSPTPIGKTPTAVALADVNGDGIPDLVA